MVPATQLILLYQLRQLKGYLPVYPPLIEHKPLKLRLTKNAQPSDLVQPGHIFPLISQPGGVLTRAGHTEAGTDLARLSGHEPASVIVEVMNEDGTMAKRPELEAFAEKHGIKIGTIADLIQYRSLHDTTIEKMDQRSVNTAYGSFVLKTYRDNISDCVHYALVRGEVTQDSPCPVRVHLLNTLRDIFQTVSPEFSDSWSLSESMKFIDDADHGVIVLIGQEFNQTDELKKVSFPRSYNSYSKIIGYGKLSRRWNWLPDIKRRGRRQDATSELAHPLQRNFWL